LVCLKSSDKYFGPNLTGFQNLSGFEKLEHRMLKKGSQSIVGKISL